MKTLNDIQQDMSELYESLKSGAMEIKTAGELANIAGKFLKAEQLKLAREIFTDNRRRDLNLLPPPDQKNAEALNVLQQ